MKTLSSKLPLKQDRNAKLKVRIHQYKNRIKDQNKKVKIHERKEIVERSRRKTLEIEIQKCRKAEESQKKIVLALETEKSVLGTDKSRLEDELTNVKVGIPQAWQKGIHSLKQNNLEPWMRHFAFCLSEAESSFGSYDY